MTTEWPAELTLTKMKSSQSSRGFKPLPDVLLQGESFTEPNDNEPQEITIAHAEARARARQRRNGSRLLRGTDRQFAEALHREADSLHYKGDYETALVLYHRAASVCPRDSSHGVAARRTAAAINALAHPSKALNGLLPKVRNGAQQSAIVCPEAAAVRASRILSESLDPVSVVPQILNFFDRRVDFWRIPNTRVTPSRRSLPAVVKGKNTLTSRIQKMEMMLNTGDAFTAIQMGSEILRNLNLKRSTSDFVTFHRYEATTYRVLTLAHVALGRHDRAVNSVSKMTRAALAVNVPLLITEALITLGKVHLTFGHLKAAAQAWEELIPFVSEPVPRAWLFHEIGRCHLENGNHKKALELSARCLDTAEAVESEKWTFHGRLLLGQTLAQMGRFTEAASALGSLKRAGEEAGDARTIAYVRDLAERLVRASNYEKKRDSCSKVQREKSKSPEEYFLESSVRSKLYSSDSILQSDEDDEGEMMIKENFANIKAAESLCSEESSVSLETESTRTILRDKEPSKFDIVAAAGDLGDSCDSSEEESSIIITSLEGTRASRESIPTGRTYGVSSPHFRQPVSKIGRDASDSETVSTIFDP